MSSRKLLLSALLLLALSPVRAGHQDHDAVKRLRDAGDILPLETIIEKYHRRSPHGRILEAELEHEHGRYVYELKALQRDGMVLELEYDAHTGELLEIEQEDK